MMYVIYPLFALQTFNLTIIWFLHFKTNNFFFLDWYCNIFVQFTGMILNFDVSGNKKLRKKQMLLKLRWQMMQSKKKLKYQVITWVQQELYLILCFIFHYQPLTMESWEKVKWTIHHRKVGGENKPKRNWWFWNVAKCVFALKCLNSILNVCIDNQYINQNISDH